MNCCTSLRISLAPAFAAAVLLLSRAGAQSTSLAATFPFSVADFALHPSAMLIYASLPAQDSVAVIDTETLEVVDTIFVGDEPRGLALAPDAEHLYVCTHGLASLAVVDVRTRQLLAPIPLPNPPWDVEAGLAGRVYVTPSGPGSAGLMQVDVQSGQALSEPLFASDVYRDALVEISPDRERLWIGNRGLSPAKLICFDVSAVSPTLVWASGHDTIGSAGQDLALTDDGAFVSYACGTGNSSSDIFKISTSTFTSTGAFVTGAFPREIAYSPDGAVAYTVNDARIKRWDATAYTEFTQITTNAEPTELAVDRTGRYVFAAFVGELRVYGSGFGHGLSTPFCFGDGRGTPCPCGNAGFRGRGCDSSLGAGGVLLEGTGLASVSSDTLVLSGYGLPTAGVALFLQGSSVLDDGSGTVFGDGLRCVGGTLRRLGMVTATAGVARIPAAGEPPISERGQVPAAPGTTRTYQLWYRNAAPFCTPETFNLSNGLITVWWY